MATKRNIKIAVRSRCVTALDGIVPAERIVRDDVDERDIAYPRVTYTAYDVPVRYNTGSKAVPHTILTDSNGNPVTEVYGMFYNLFVDLIVEGESQDCDEIYAALKDSWIPFERWLDDSDLHEDVNDIVVGGANEPNNTDTEPTAFATMLQLEVEYRKDVTRDGTPIEEIHHNMDVDHDGSTDVTYTTDETNS